MTLTMAQHVTPWTEIQDVILLGLKERGKSWRDIAKNIEGKGTEDLRERYDHLVALKASEEAAAKAKEEAEQKAKEEAEAIAKAVEEKKAIEEAEMRAKQKAEIRAEVEAEIKAKAEEEKRPKAEKGKGKGKGKGKATADQISGSADDKKAEKGDKGKGQKGKSQKEKKEGKKEETRAGKAGSSRDPDREFTYVDNEGFSESEIHYLWGMHQDLEEAKWQETASTYFDKTGARLSGESLKAKMDKIRKLAESNM